MRIEQAEKGVTYYLEVESEYFEPRDGKGKNNAVSFVMGQHNENGHEIDSVVSVSVENAREFAKTILTVCDEIEA